MSVSCLCLASAWALLLPSQQATGMLGEHRGFTFKILDLGLPLATGMLGEHRGGRFGICVVTLMARGLARKREGDDCGKVVGCCGISTEAASLVFGAAPLPYGSQ